MKINLLFLYFFYLLGSCTVIDKSENMIDLESVIDEYIVVNLSTLCDSAYCIGLETTDEALLANNVSLIYMDTEDIFINSEKMIYRFGIDGHFKNKIGKIGGGPSEYFIPYKRIVDPEHKRLLFLVENNEIQFWDYNGFFIESVKIDKSLGAISYLEILPNSKFVCELNKCKESATISCLAVFEYNGKILWKKELYRDYLSVNKSINQSAIMYKTGDEVRYKNPYNDILYSCNGDLLRIERTFFLGEYSPTRDILEDINRKDELVSDFVQILDINESEQYYYLLMLNQKELQGIIIDKNKNYIVYNSRMKNPKKGGGIKNDLFGIGNLWPNYISKNGDLVGLVQPENLIEGLLTINSKRKNRIVIEENSNPFVIVDCMKKDK